MPTEEEATNAMNHLLVETMAFKGMVEEFHELEHELSQKALGAIDIVERLALFNEARLVYDESTNIINAQARLVQELFKKVQTIQDEMKEQG